MVITKIAYIFCYRLLFKIHKKCNNLNCWQILSLEAFDPLIQVEKVLIY